MGYYKNLIIERQTEVADRKRKGRRETYREPDVITDKRTLIFLTVSASFFSITTVILTIWLAVLV